jgi:hypothetical protein
VISFSCKKTEEETKVELLNNFYPNTVGTMWTYTDYPKGDVYSQQVTGIDSTFSGKKYRGMVNTKSGLSWYRKDGNNHYMLYVSGSQQVEHLFLKENTVVGTAWDVKFTVSGIDNRVHYSIAEYDVPKIVFGNIYMHCIVVQVASYVNNGGGETLVGNAFHTYANNIGLVYIERSEQDKTYLNDFKIN